MSCSCLRLYTDGQGWLGKTVDGHDSEQISAHGRGKGSQVVHGETMCVTVDILETEKKKTDLENAAKGGVWLAQCWKLNWRCCFRLISQVSDARCAFHMMRLCCKEFKSRILMRALLGPSWINTRSLYGYMAWCVYVKKKKNVFHYFSFSLYIWKIKAFFWRLVFGFGFFWRSIVVNASSVGEEPNALGTSKPTWDACISRLTVEVLCLCFDENVLHSEVT